MGEVHARASRLAGATVQGIAASTESRAMQAAERLGIARFYSTGEEAIDDPSVSVIHVCTPNASHFPLGWPLSTPANTSYARNHWPPAPVTLKRWRRLSNVRLHRFDVDPLARNVTYLIRQKTGWNL